MGDLSAAGEGGRGVPGGGERGAQPGRRQADGTGGGGCPAGGNGADGRAPEAGGDKQNMIRVSIFDFEKLKANQGCVIQQPLPELCL